MRPKILLVDDDRNTRTLFEGLLQPCDYDLHTVCTLSEARDSFASIDFNLLILDQRLPDGLGLEFFSSIRAQRPQQLVILITGYADIRDAVQAVQCGLFDYLTKPFKSIDELLAAINRALEVDRAYRHINGLEAALQANCARCGAVGNSPAIQKLLQRITQIARCDSTVLIEGETGTGKQFVAQQIHLSSARSKGLFIVLHCAGLSESLLEATLFGYEKPAYSKSAEVTPGYLEEAHGGTLVLDEICELGDKLQSSLLNVLQNRIYVRLGSAVQRASDFRLICTSTQPLDDAVRADKFRADLAYRINVNRICVPPLRDRRQDILPLALFFLNEFNRKFVKTAGPFAPEAMEFLENANWPGNVRELKNAVERAVAANARGAIIAADLRLEQTNHEARDKQAEPRPELLSLDEAKELFEREYFVNVLHATRGNISDAAKLSRISRTSFYRYVRQLGLVAET
jgi:DNA-binding NtrC family response regulator